MSIRHTGPLTVALFKGRDRPDIFVDCSVVSYHADGTLSFIDNNGYYHRTCIDYEVIDYRKRDTQ